MAWASDENAGSLHCGFAFGRDDEGYGLVPYSY
jgi:hypothetical protein